MCIKSKQEPALLVLIEKGSLCCLEWRHTSQLYWCRPLQSHPGICYILDNDRCPNLLCNISNYPTFSPLLILPTAVLFDNKVEVSTVWHAEITPESSDESVWIPSQ